MIHLPVEIWRHILLYAIDSPSFLFIDPLPAESPSNEAEYWDSERTRNALRRVCSSWNLFLASYKSRFVRTSDVIHRHVPTVSLAYAVHIKVDICTCLRCISFGNDPVHSNRIFQNRILSADTVNDRAPWRVEIIDAQRGEYLEVITSEPRHISKLRAIYHWRGSLPATVFSQSPLSFLVAHADDLARMKRIDVSNMTTLSLYGIQPTHLSLVHFPNLVHAWVQMRWPPLDHLRVTPVLEWLKLHGRRLETFYWSDDVSKITDSDVDKLWSLCPNLQRVQLPLDARWTPPPSSHQLQLVRVEEHDEIPAAACSVCSTLHDYSIQLSDSLGQIAGSSVHRIQASPLVWHERMTYDNEPSVYCFMIEAQVPWNGGC